jgi:ABC-2 type transport system ATP-binding protein
MPPVSPLQYQQLFAPFYPNFDTIRYVAYLKKFELDAQANLARCSFGQRKKCLLAFGLAANCRLTFLDEPTNGLDIPSKSQLRRALASVVTEDRLFIIATHQVRDLESLIDPVIILDQGRIIFNQTMAAISQRLWVRLLDAAPNADEVLYTEKTLEGFRVVLENPGAEETHIDLELLFNTVISNCENVAAIFERRSTHASPTIH